MKLTELPDHHVLYIPGYGEATVGEVRASEEKPAVAFDREMVIRRACEIATRNLCRTTWETTGAGRLERRA